MHGSRRCVLVLASGRGVRMGGPKAIMPVGGEAWWRVQMRRLAGVESVWVVSALVEAEMGRHDDAPAHRVPGDSETPMFASVVAGMRQIAERGEPAFVHVLPVDVPAPSARVFDALEVTASRAGVAVPSWEGVTGHPLCMTWAWGCANVLGHAHEAAQARLDELSAACRAVVAVDDPSVRVNLNTPDAVRAWEAWGGGASRDERGGDQAGPRQ
ncbi:MAG: nucleotidyltransferase family protein [Phycisphaerales bacterium]|nr:nucleotidyltransferase family protein [Phycisphaerales bacterium]